MKSIDIFDTNAEYEEEIEFFGMNFSDMDEFDPVDNVHSPVHANIDPNTNVALISNSFVISSGSWRDVSKFITDNWLKLNGRYDISTDGAVLHTFTVAR